MHVSLIKKPLVRLPVQASLRVSLGHFEFKPHSGFYLHTLLKTAFDLGNYRWFSGQEIAVTNYVSEKTFVFLGCFRQLRVKRATEIRAREVALCLVVAPQAYIRYKRDQVFVTSKKTLALSQTSFLSCEQQAFRGPTLAS